MAMVRLRERANNAEKALDSTNDGYWVLSPTGAFIDVNQSYCRMMGYTRNEVMSMSIADFEAVAAPVGARTGHLSDSSSEDSL